MELNTEISGEIMSKYAISDLHGCYDEFVMMLKLIGFSEEDELFILGDIFDRGDKPLEILDYIWGHKNIHLIKGNHEDMLQESLVNYEVRRFYEAVESKTYKEIIMRGPKFREKLYDYISALPLYIISDDNVMVHAGILLPENYRDLRIDEILEMQKTETLLWTRDNIDKEIKIEGYNIICGHTPVQAIDADSEETKILKRNGTYYIDCGCIFKKLNGKLACLRLEDKKEFYVLT